MKSTIVALAEVHGLEHMLHKVTSEHHNYLVFTSVHFADKKKIIIVKKKVPPTQLRDSVMIPDLCCLRVPCFWCRMMEGGSMIQTVK